MNAQKKFRRPAILTPEQSEMIEGSEDPAESAIVANEVAQAFIDTDPSDKRIERIRHTVQNEGPDQFAPLWQGQPQSSIPGVLWRAYVMLQWWDTDEETIRHHFDVGVNTTFIRTLYGQVETTAAAFFQRTRDLLWGKDLSPFGDYLVMGAKVFYTIAAGVAAEGSDLEGEDARQAIREKAESLSSVADDFKDCLWRYSTRD